MAEILKIVAICIFFAGPILAGPASYISYGLPETRSHLIPRKVNNHFPSDVASTSDYEYQIIPSDEYTIAEYDAKNYLSLVDTFTLPTPIMAIARIASCALSAASWLLSSSGFIILGAILIAGFCSFTSFCTLSIEPSLSAQLHAFHFPYLNDLHHFFLEAYDKYHEM